MRDTTCKGILEIWGIEPVRRDIRGAALIIVDDLNGARVPVVTIVSSSLSPWDFKSTKKGEAFIRDHIHTG